MCTYVFPYTGHALYFFNFLYTLKYAALVPNFNDYNFRFCFGISFCLPWNWVDLYYVCMFVCNYYLFCSLLLLLNIYSLYNIFR